MSWSYWGRRVAGCSPSHKTESNCYRFAVSYQAALLERLPFAKDGRHVHQSPILSDPDDHEDEALDELHRLAEELKQIDPPAFDGYHGYIWAEFLERWLW